jgi:trk system potassium uptake protein TrkH
VVTPGQVLVVGFAGLILLGSLILMLPWATAPGQTTAYIDALFTATSAVCVTGLITVLTATQWTFFGKVVVLSLIQMGGLGIMTMSALFMLLLGRRFSLKERLVMQEALGLSNLAGLVRLTKYILMVTFLFEGTGALLLFLRFRFDMPSLQAAWFAVFHSISAFCNAGFDLFGDSLVRYVSDWQVSLTIAGLIIFGGLGFFVIVEAYQVKGHWHKLSVHSRLAIVVTGLLLVTGTLLIYILEYDNPFTLKPLSAGAKWLASFFHSVTPRTAGYNTLPVDKMTPGALLVTIILMFIGASPGGTGGGIKTTTFAVLLLTVTAITGGSERLAFNKRIPRDTVEKSLAIAFISLSMLVGVVLVLLTTEKKPLMDLLFEATSAFGTVGLSTGVTPQLTTVGKLGIILLMYSGRVGPLTLAMALAQHGPHPAVRHPEERVMVG